MARWPIRTKKEYDQQWLARVRANSVRTESGCLVWQGNLTVNGYPQTNYRNKGCRIHRRLYEIVRGITLDRWVYVCHSCDTRRCIEEAHLWTGTPSENQQDMKAKGRSKYSAEIYTHCKHGHEFTPENTRITARGFRACRMCARIKCRLAAGWTREQAESMPLTPPGHRPVNVRFKTGTL